MKTLYIVPIIVVGLLAGCVSYDGRGLVPGKSTAADVESLMGRPAERIEKPGGGSVLYYPHGPAGRDTYAVAIGADGKVQSVEQRLTDANIAKLVVGTTTAKDVRELFGPPSVTTRLVRQERDVWEYPMGVPWFPQILLVQLSYDGTVREVFKVRDWSIEVQSGSDMH